eukprot:scaffold38892_cov32-Tisochrysis_lutea.AAC.6
MGNMCALAHGIGCWSGAGILAPAPAIAELADGIGAAAAVETVDVPGTAAVPRAMGGVADGGAVLFGAVAGCCIGCNASLCMRHAILPASRIPLRKAPATVAGCSRLVASPAHRSRSHQSGSAITS